MVVAVVAVVVAYAYYYACTCIIHSGRLAVHMRKQGGGGDKNPSMPGVCVSVSQIVSHSVSSCVCVSAVAVRK